MRHGFIYIVCENDHDIVKVGVSKNPFTRMRVIANSFGFNFEKCWFYVSSMKVNAYSIEKKCHKELSKYLCGGFGPDKLYPRETFKCGIEDAREMLEDIVHTYQAKRPNLYHDTY